MKAPTSGVLPNSTEGERKSINSELWHACAGPLVSLPPVGSLVVYFPQGHSEQVAASMQKETNFVPSYPNLPSKLICLLQNVTMHADTETDEVYAQMTLQPVTKYDKEALIASDMALKHSRQPAEFFCKTLTASDTSTHGGFSVPRRAAEKIFPPLDFSMQPPAQELGAKDIHDNTWAFRHIYRGQPKRHLLTTGWSVFVSTKRLSAGDSVLFIRDGKQHFLGIRPANRQQSALSSSVISSDSMHIGILAAAAHAAANNSPFTIFYNPRASPSEFVVPLAKYSKAMYAQVSLGMRFRMMFETEESGVRRYMGTITGISDLDPVRWKNSQWRSLQVGWDESTTGERPSRVSIWDIEPVVAPFYICPPPFFRPRFPKQPGMLDDESDIGSAFKRAMPWLGDDFGTKDTPSTFLPGLSLAQWMSMQQTNQFPVAQSGTFPMMLASTADDPSKLLNFQAPASSASNSLFNKPNGNLANQLSPPLPLPQQQQLQQLLQNPSNQQQLQQLLQNPMNQQQLQQILQTPMNQQQQLQQPQQHLQQQQPQQAQQQKLQQLQQQLQQQSQQPLQQLQQHLLDHQQSPSHQRPSQQLQMQQASLSSQTNNGMFIPNQVPNQTIQHAIYTHGQQTQLLTSNTQSVLSATKTSYPLTTLPQDLRQQQILEQKPSFTERYQQQTQLHQSPVQVSQQSLSEKAQQQPPLQQLIQQGLSEQQIRLQLLQKLQQQTPQLPSPSGSLLQGQMLQHQISQQNHQLAPLSASQNQQQLCSGNGFSTSGLLPSQQLLSQNRSVPGIRSHSGLTDGDPPSCSTSPSTNNCQVSPTKFVNRNGHGLAVLPTDPVIEPVNSLLQELQSKPDNQMKNEIPRSKASDQVKYRNSAADQLEASSSGASYCLDNGSAQQNYSLPTFLDGDAQSHPRGSLPFTGNIGGMAPDTLLSKGYDSQKDLQNLLSAYGGAPKDIETELSTAGISSQSFSVPNMSFKAGYSNDVPLNEAGILSGGLWANQTPRMRTYTKVQKRGSVGRSIDVTRYKGYDELRHDLARMFGIEGQLEDPQCSDWKLVYVDHEKDILLVGDDPWEEFVSCVQSIKILSSAEVQQMSLDGDLGNAAFPNQACSGTDSGNAWRHYDENSAVSFNR